MTEKIKIEGVELSYIKKGQGPVILYIHGNLGSKRWYEKALDVDGYTSIALDLPNFGDSDHIATFSMAEYGIWVSRFIEEVSPEGVVLLVGHSLGGAVAMETISLMKEKVQHLMLIDSCPVNGLQTPEAYHPIIQQYLVDRALLTQSLGSVVPSLSDPVLLELLVDDALKMKPEAYIGHAVELGKVSYLDITQSYNLPVLVIRGGLDVLITQEMTDELANAFPQGETKVFTEVGHSVMVENPKLFTNCVKEFLA